MESKIDSEALAQLRENATALINEGVDKWRVNYQLLIGVAEGIMGQKMYDRSPAKVMAKKLCSLYMHNEGYSYTVIASVIGVKSHCTPLFHSNGCREFIKGDSFGDRSYKLAHKKAQELGIAV